MMYMAQIRTDTSIVESRPFSTRKKALDALNDMRRDIIRGGGKIYAQRIHNVQNKEERLRSIK